MAGLPKEGLASPNVAVFVSACGDAVRQGQTKFQISELGMASPRFFPWLVPNAFYLRAGPCEVVRDTSRGAGPASVSC